MVHTSSAGDVASTMECTRGLRLTSVHTPYGSPIPGGSHRHCRSAAREAAPAHRSRAWSAPAEHAHTRASLGTPTVPAPSAALTAPETSRAPGGTDPLLPSHLAPPVSGAPGLPGLPPNRVLIRFQPEVSPGTRREMLCAAGARVREEFADGELLIDFDPTAAGSTAARRLAGSAAVALCRRVTVIAAGDDEAEPEETRAARLRTAVAATA